MFGNHNGDGTRTAGAALRQVRKRLSIRLRQVVESDDGRFVAGWPALVAEVEAGFWQEESIMETLRHPGLQPHRADNACILCALHRVTPQVEAGDTALARQALLALADILSLHRLTAGVALADRRPRPGPVAGRLKAGLAQRPSPDRRPLPAARPRLHHH